MKFQKYPKKKGDKDQEEKKPNRGRGVEGGSKTEKKHYPGEERVGQKRPIIYILKQLSQKWGKKVSVNIEAGRQTTTITIFLGEC